MLYVNYKDYRPIKELFHGIVYITIIIIVIMICVFALVHGKAIRDAEKNTAKAAVVYHHFVEIEKSDGSKDTLCFRTTEKELKPDIKSFDNFTFIVNGYGKDCFKSFFENIKEIEKAKNIKILKSDEWRRIKE